MPVRVLAVDHGEKRIGIALSDLTGTLARPLAILDHQSRDADVQHVTEIARDHRVELILVGESLDEDGHPNQAGRRARRFAEALRAVGELPVEMWDESLSSQDARLLRIAGGASKKKRAGAIDAEAAAVILQSYLDAHPAGQNQAQQG
jgi:putative Holliday junction resolvase